MEAFRPAVESGKVRYLGLSECNLDTLRRAKAVQGVDEKVVAVKIKYSPFTLNLEKDEGTAGVLRSWECPWWRTVRLGGG